MNDLGLILVRAALQGTLVALVAVLLYAWAARRGPGSGAPVVVAFLFATVVLTILAFTPLPSWWAWSAGPPEPLEVAFVPENDQPTLPGPSPHQAVAPAAATYSEKTGGLALSARWLRNAWKRLGQSEVSSSESRWRWPEIVALAFLTGSGLYLLRLLVGLWGVRVCRRRSRPIDDVALVQLLESLRREMSCSTPVGLRESPDLTTPATIGWWRPLVLLPGDWRAWTEAERRTVLAHELAHVLRSDYAAGLLAQARRGPALLPTAGPLAGRPIAASAGAGGRRPGGAGRRAAGPLPGGTFEDGTSTTGQASGLACPHSFDPWNLDEENRHVASEGPLPGKLVLSARPGRTGWVAGNRGRCGLGNAQPRTEAGPCGGQVVASLSTSSTSTFLLALASCSTRVTSTFLPPIPRMRKGSPSTSPTCLPMPRACSAYGPLHSWVSRP